MDVISLNCREGLPISLTFFCLSFSRYISSEMASWLKWSPMSHPRQPMKEEVQQESAGQGLWSAGIWMIPKCRNHSLCLDASTQRVRDGAMRPGRPVTRPVQLQRLSRRRWWAVSFHTGCRAPTRPISSATPTSHRAMVLWPFKPSSRGPWTLKWTMMPCSAVRLNTQPSPCLCRLRSLWVSSTSSVYVACCFLRPWQLLSLKVTLGTS